MTAAELERMISRGKADARRLAHARILLQADEAEGGPARVDEDVASALDASIRTVELARVEAFAGAIGAGCGPQALLDEARPQALRGRAADIQRRNDPLVRPGWAALGLVGLEQDLRVLRLADIGFAPGERPFQLVALRCRQGHLMLLHRPLPVGLHQTNRPASHPIMADDALAHRRIRKIHEGPRPSRIPPRAQSVCPVISADDRARLKAIVADRNRARKHVARARRVLLSAERLDAAAVARRVGIRRPAGWRWQQRLAETGVDGLLRDQSREPGKTPSARRTVHRVVALTCGAGLKARPPLGPAGRWMAEAVGLSLRAVGAADRAGAQAAATPADPHLQALACSRVSRQA
jgi:hypothetical protein